MSSDETHQDPCLERLFASLPGDDFLASYWPAQHVVCHGPLARLGALAEVPEFDDLELLMSRYHDKICVVMPDRRDEYSAMQVDALTAKTLHHNGMALILDGVERFFPLVQEWLERLRVELALPKRCDPHSIIYASPRGAGNSPHFDANANFVVQLRGTKRWHVAPNRHVPHPTDRWAMNQEGLPEELDRYVACRLPTRMPADAQAIDLSPGSVLFVPRGYWHATEADEDTLALNFTFGQPTWADLVLTALRRRLLGDARWREMPVGLFAADPARAASAMAGLLDKLTELQGVARTLGPREILEASDALPEYVLVPDATVRIEDGGAVAYLGANEQFRLDAAEQLFPILAWINMQGTPFSLDALAMRFPELCGALPELLQQLRVKGILAVYQPAIPDDQFGPAD